MLVKSPAAVVVVPGNTLEGTHSLARVFFVAEIFLETWDLIGTEHD